MIERLVGWFRWRSILRSCRYDPGIDPDLREPDERVFIMCGCPRSGTSLLASQLFQPPGLVTCMEPWDGLRMPLADLGTSLMDEIESTGRLGRGRLDIDALEGGAVVWQSEGTGTFAVETAPGFQLGIKWPSYWRYLDLLDDARFLVCVRHPAEVIESFGHQQGRLREGLDYDVPFNAEMNRALAASSTDAATRRALHWEYVNSRIIPHLDRPNVLLVRYERWFDDPGGLMADIGDFLGTGPLTVPIPITGRGSIPSARSFELAERFCSSASELGYG